MALIRVWNARGDSPGVFPLSILLLNISASQDPVFWLTGFMSPPEQTQAACGGAGQRASRRSFVLPDAAEHFDGEMFREKAVQLSSCR